VGADVSDPRLARSLVEETVARFGRLDVVVNNAGVWQPTPLVSARPEAWARVLAANLDGTFFVSQAAARVMRRAGSGSIVLISSTAGQRGEAFHGAYAASKGAAISLTKSWAVELARYGIRVNCVAPGWVDTEMTAAALAGAGRRAIARTILLGRVGEPHEVARAVLFLAGDAASFITGEILN